MGSTPAFFQEAFRAVYQRQIDATSDGTTIWNEPYSPSKEPYILWKEPYILLKTRTLQCIVINCKRNVRWNQPYKRAMHSTLWKEPYILSKEPYILRKWPYILWKEPYISSKEPYFLWKRHYILWKVPYSLPKQTYVLTKETYWLSKWRHFGRACFRTCSIDRDPYTCNQKYWRYSFWEFCDTLLLTICVNDRALLQNIISFIGLYCKRDLSFWEAY